MSTSDTAELLRTLPWAVLALAADGTVDVLNPAAEALWGVPAAAVLGHLPAQVQPAVLPLALVQALAEAAPAAGPYWLPHTRQWITLRTAPAAEGRRWIYWENVTASQPADQTAQPLPDFSQTATHGAAQPPTQAALHQAEERYRRLFEAMTQGFCVVEVLFDAAGQPVDYRFLVTNPAFEQATGLRDAAGQTMRTLRPAHEDQWFEMYGQVARTGEPQRFARAAKQLGRFYDVYAFRVGDPAAHTVAIVFNDLSGLRRTEEALRESEASYRTLLNSMDEGYFLCEVVYDEQAAPVDLLYLDANPAAIRMTGADFRGKRLCELGPDYESYWFEIFGRVARTGVGERLERYAAPDQKWYDFYVHPAGEASGRRVAVVFQDITARKQHEQGLRASEAQVEADLAGMRRLYELQAKLADQTDVQAAFRDVLALACEFTGTDRGCVQFLSSDGQRLEMFVWQGYANDGPFISFFRYEGLAAGCEVARVQRQRLIIEDTVGFEGLDGTEAGAASAAEGIRAAQSTPMTSRTNETMGVISTQFRQPHRPSDHELRLLDMLAWTAAEFLERHRADAARRASEQQFRLMADAVPQIVWLTDAEGRVEFFNKQWSDYTGVPYEPTTAAEVAASFVHPDDGAATMAAFTEARVTGSMFLVEHRIRSRAGDYRWFLVRAEPYRDADTGEIVRWFGASVDIHDRKQAEVALEKAHERLQLAMNVGRIFSFEMNPATRGLELSDNVDIVMGFPLPDHIDSTFELIHPDDLPPTVALINGAIDSRGSYASDYRLVNPTNGEVVWFHSQAAFTQSNVSGEWRFVGIAQNITESKKAEEALRESEAKFRSLFNSIDEGYYLLEVLPDERGEAADVLFLDANPAAIRMSGTDRRGKRLREVGSYEAYWYELYGRVARTGVGERTEQFSETAGIWVNSYTFKVGETGNRVAAVFRDVTERKRREANLAFLADLTNEFASSATVDDIVQRVGANIGAYLNVAAVVFADVDEAQGQVTVSHGWVETGALSIVGQSYRFEEYLTPEFQRLSHAGEVFVVRDTQTDPRTDAALYAALQIHAWVVVPFHRAGEWRHCLTAYNAEARDWRADEIELFRELANRIFPRLERARAEEALRESEAKYRTLFETMDEGFAVCELLRDETGRAIDWRYLELNPAWEQQTGLSRALALHRTARELLPGLEDELVQTFARVVETGEPARFEYYIEPMKRWYHHLAFSQGGQRFAVLYDDITARKKAEEVLRQSEAWQAYLLALSDALRSVEEAADMQAAVARTAMRYFQADRCYYGEVTGDTVTVRRDAARPGLPSVAGEYSLLTMPIFEAMLRGNQLVVVADVRTSAVMDDNLKELCLGFGIIAYIIVPIIKNGKQVGMLNLTQGTPREWTHLETALAQETAERTWAAVERARAEEALREFTASLEAQVAARTRDLRDNQALLQSVFDTSLISMSVLHAVRDEAGTIQDFRIAAANKELEHETGRTDLVGKLYSEEYPGIRLVGIYDIMLRVMETGQPDGLEYHYTFEGFDKWFICQFVKVDDGLVATNLDITERKTAELEQAKSYQLLRQSEEVADLGSWDYNRTTGEFQWSAGMYRLFSLPPGSPIRPAIYLEFAVPEDRAVAERIVQGLTTARTGFEETLRIRVNGAVKTVRVKAAVVPDAAGEPLRVLGVDLDISEVQRLEAENLHMRLTQQQALFTAVLGAQETERRRMAESLHNGLGQTLYAVKLQLHQVPAALAPPALAQADRLLAEAIRQTRTLSHELVPTVLSEFGLPAALRDICRALGSPELRFDCTAELDEPLLLPQPLQVALYRMAQELAQNVVKHAHATEASLELETVPGYVLLRVEDNGAGFAKPVSTAAAGIGLRTIRDQVALLGGTVDVGSSPVFGTYVRLRIPLPTPAIPPA